MVKCWVKPIDDTLKEMITYYDDVADQDAAVIESNKLDKQDKEGGKYTGEDVRF